MGLWNRLFDTFNDKTNFKKKPLVKTNKKIGLFFMKQC